MKLRIEPIGLLTLFAAGISRPVHAELIPTPDFSSHPIPTSVLNDAAASGWQVFDVAALLIALCLATYFAIVSRSRRYLWWLTLASLAYFGFIRSGCVCPIGATQNVALGLADPTVAVPLIVVAFFTLPLVFTLFFGRTFCAAVCPLGAIQELVAIRSVAVPVWLDRSLRKFPYVYLGLAVILAATNTAFIICRFDPFVAMFRLHGSAPMLVFGFGLLAIGTFVGRPYCRYLCPYGAILGVLSRFSKWHLRIHPSACIKCRLCEDVCPYGAIHPPTTDRVDSNDTSGKNWFVTAIALAPVLIALGALIGWTLGAPLAGWHPEVRLAEELYLDEQGQAVLPSDAVEAYRNAGHTSAEAYQVAADWRQRYATLGIWLGAWVGLVVGGSLIQFSRKPHRTEYQPERTGCVSCGRCFWYCPVEQERLGLIECAADAVPENRRDQVL